jgi:hypothetical protein
LLSVFAVGTLSFADTVDAAKWKKFDSGSVKVKGQTIKYYAFIKGSTIQVDYYYKNKFITGYDLVKGKNKVTIRVLNSEGYYTSKNTYKTKKSLKSYYYSFNNLVKKQMKK